MSEVEKQESQKTVVAFITGLLIGGLLVWVFSSTPEQAVTLTEKPTDTQETAGTETTGIKDVADTTSVVGEGSVTVANQKAGNMVSIAGTEFPTKNGWIVVRDYMDGMPGNILGAARYSADEGLAPTTIELMRATTAGSSYQVVFYTNEGDTGFVIGEDKPIEGIATTFKAN